MTLAFKHLAGGMIWGQLCPCHIDILVIKAISPGQALSKGFVDVIEL